MVARAFKPNTPETEAELRVQDQPSLKSKFQDINSYTERLGLKKIY